MRILQLLRCTTFELVLCIDTAKRMIRGPGIHSRLRGQTARLWCLVWHLQSGFGKWKESARTISAPSQRLRQSQFASVAVQV